MNLILRILAVGLLAAASVLSAQTGSVTGRVTDAATGLSLDGVRVVADGLSRETFTRDGGQYSLRDLPEGAVTLVFSYVGYPDFTQDASVASGEIVRVDAVFNEATRLSEFVIEGSAVGTARAINQQRAAASLSTIVAADEIGRFPDQNAAESLQRLPGVALYRDQGEGRFIVLRGLNYNLNSVTVNGAKVASPELGDRSIALDVLPSDALAAVKVTKVLTPDMDGEGLGGAIDIQTKSAFDQTGRAVDVTLQGIYSRITEELSPKVNATYSDIFNDGKLGVLVAVTFQERDYGSYNFEEDGWTEEESPTDGEEYFIMEGLAFRHYEILRTRFGLSGGLEFKPDDSSYYFVKGTFNSFVDEEYRHVTVLPFERGTIVDLNAESAAVDNISRVTRELRIREKDQELFALSAGGNREIGAWKLEALASYSIGREERPDEISLGFRRNAADVDLTYDFNGPYDVDIIQRGGPDIFVPANYTNLDEFVVNNEEGEETELGLRLDGRRDFGGETPMFVKFGVNLRQKEKESQVDSVEYEVPSGFTFGNNNQGPGEYPFLRVPRIDPERVKSAFYASNSGFEGEDLILDSAIDDWTSNEDVYAAYVMGGVTAGRLQVLAGVRYEHTNFETNGFAVQDEEVVVPTASDRDYDNWLPGVHFRYDVNDRLVLRASYTKSILRPSFGESALFREINNEDEEITQGNPDLQELESDNFDVSAEYYLPSLGLVSVAVFAKDVANFSYEFETESEDPNFPGYEVTTFANGSSGKITGLELAYQQQLTFLPEPFDGIGFLANITFVDAEADYPTRPGEKLPFIGQSEQVGNVALTYERAGFFARLALNFRTERLREDEPIGGDEAEDRYVDDFMQLDFTTSYRFSENWEVFAEVTNITNEPFKVFFRTPGGGPERLAQFEEYDITANFGVRWKL